MAAGCNVAQLRIQEYSTGKHDSTTWRADEIIT